MPVLTEQFSRFTGLLDDTVRQYTADILVRQGEEDPGQQASVSVNHPARIRGLTFDQNSTGWAANITVSKNGAQLQSDVVCVGEVCPVRELPELEKLRQDYADKGVQVAGILLETSAAALEDAKSILRDAGADYPVLLPTEEMGELINVQYIPTTYFVDPQGRVLGEAVVGADVQGYRDRLDQLLK